MRRLTIPLLILGLLGFFSIGCDSGVDESGTVTLSGQVLDQETNNPVPGAFIRILPFDLLFESDEEGRYVLDIQIDSTMNLDVRAGFEGYSGANVSVLAIKDRLVEVPILRIRKVVEDTPESGKASNILLKGQSTQSIGVRESGSEEVASITFQVADSLGRPVILENTAFVNFSLGVQPGGGEFIYPEQGQTDNNGLVTVNLSSGTVAGVVQILAETVVDGRTIRSLPVAVAIHGGHPDQTHFSIGPQRFNFPGLNTFGITDPISVIVGDKYSNPVKPGTAVYFNASFGVVEGSVLTDAEGRGTVDLISANPLPPDGIGLVTATTADENQNVVTGSTPVVFSGVPWVRVSPTNAALNQTYRITVTDQNGNPLAAGTVLSVRVEGTKVKAVGNTNVTFDDTAFIGGNKYEHVARGPGITEFAFRAVEDLTIDEDGSPTVEAITILVSGPNGRLEIVLGEGIPFVRTDGASMMMVSDNTVEFRVDQ